MAETKVGEMEMIAPAPANVKQESSPSDDRRQSIGRGGGSGGRHNNNSRFSLPNRGRGRGSFIRNLPRHDSPAPVQPLMQNDQDNDNESMSSDRTRKLPFKGVRGNVPISRFGREEERVNEKLSVISGSTQDLPQKDATEKKFSSRCRLFVGNIGTMTEEELQELFKTYGEVNECFVNTEKQFAFIRLDFRANAERAKRELDGSVRGNRSLKVRFAPVGAAIKVRNLTPWVTNELLEYAFSVFGDIEYAKVLVDERGKSLQEGIVEFARKPMALFALKRCSEGCFLLTNSLRPVVVEPYDFIDDVDGFSEKSITRKPIDYMKEREVGPRFAPQETFEFDYGNRWKNLYELYRQKEECLKRELKLEEEKLEAQMEFARYEHDIEAMREELKRREMERDRHKMEMEMRERQAEQLLQIQDAEMLRRRDEVVARMKVQEEDLRRRKLENESFIQNRGMDYGGPNGNIDDGRLNLDGKLKDEFEDQQGHFQQPNRPPWPRRGYPGPGKRGRF